MVAPGPGLQAWTLDRQLLHVRFWKNIENTIITRFLACLSWQHRLENRCLFPNIYNMKNQFWAGLGSRASTWKKKFWADYEQLLRAFFLCFQGQKKKNNNNNYYSVHTEKLHRKKVIFFFFFGNIFFLMFFLFFIG